MANHAAKYLGNGLVVVIKAGAAGVTGSTYVALSKADGYTLLLGRVGSQNAVPALNKTIPYAWDDFTMLGLFEFNPFSLTVSAESGYNSIDDLKKAVASGKKLTYSSAENGSLQHVAMIVLLDTLGLPQSSMTHVPFKGGGRQTPHYLMDTSIFSSKTSPALWETSNLGSSGLSQSLQTAEIQTYRTFPHLKSWD